MYSSGVDTGMRFVELQQVSDAEMMSILTTLGSAHKDFAHSISHMSCVELLLVVFYRYFLVQHVARPLAVVVGSATSRNSARRSHTHENHIARGQCVCVYGCACFRHMTIFPECKARIPVSLWGCGGGAVFARRCTTVRNRPREVAMAVPKFCKRGLLEVSGVA